MASLAVSAAGQLPLSRGTTAHFLPALEAREELGRQDSFIRALSPFDRAARLKQSNPVGQEEFIAFVQEQALDWTELEREKLTKAIEQIRERVAPYAKHLPSRIKLIKTTGREEGDAAYCRRYSIVLPVSKLESSSDHLRKLLEHELFHIISRKNGPLKNQLYALIGFKPCPVVRLPEPYFSRKLTNPDAPLIRHYIEVTYKGSPIKAMPVLFSRQEKFDPSIGSDFFAFLTFKLMVVEQHENEWRVALQDGQPQLLDVRDVDHFFQQIGRNTNYIIHPEEILADNFQFLLERLSEVPTPEIIQKMGDLLSASAGILE